MTDEEVLLKLFVYEQTVTGDETPLRTLFRNPDGSLWRERILEYYPRLTAAEKAEILAKEP